MPNESKVNKSENYRKNRVKRIKRIIVITIVILIVLPMVLCVFLLFRVQSLEKRIDQVIVQTGVKIPDESSGVPIAKAASRVKPTSYPSISPSASPVNKPVVKKVYLTFEDGPSQQTGKILDILKQEKIKATFFVVGHQDSYSKKIYQRIVKEGHTLGMHSYSHLNKEIYKSVDAFKSDFFRLQNFLYKVTGVKAKYYRFPGGSSVAVSAISIQQFKTFLASQKCEYFDWNVVNGDSFLQKLSNQQMVSKVLNSVKGFDTSIVQMHDSSEMSKTTKTLRKVIDGLKKEGCAILPISDSTTKIQHIK